MAADITDDRAISESLHVSNGSSAGVSGFGAAGLKGVGKRTFRLFLV